MISELPRVEIGPRRNGQARAPQPAAEQAAPESDGAAAKPAAASDPCAAMVEAGDVGGLLAWLRSKSILDLPPDALDHLARAIRKGQADLDGLVDAAYGEVIGFVVILLVRCQLHVERRLAGSDRFGGDPTHLPHDLDSDGWLSRIEKITRFLMEVSTTRERVRHVARLNTNERPSPIKFNPFNGSPLDPTPHPAGNGQVLPRNRRVRGAESRVRFP